MVSGRSWCLSAALSVLAGAAGGDPAARKVELKKGDRVLLFGDSLTALATEEARVVFAP